MNLRLSQLRKIIAEETRRLVLEEEDKSKSEKEKGEDSLDSQIDSFLASYEREAKSSKKEGFNFRLLTRRFLTEAEDEDKKKDKKDEEEPEKMSADDIDVDSFADNVVRLVDNYDSLLEVRDAICRRAVNFLLKNYEKEVADSFKEALSEQHDIEIGKSKSELEDEKFIAPPAACAGNSPGGA